MVGILKVPTQFPMETQGLSAELRQFPQFPDFFIFFQDIFLAIPSIIAYKGKKVEDPGNRVSSADSPSVPIGN